MKTLWMKTGLLGALLLLVVIALSPGLGSAQESVPPSTTEAAGAQDETAPAMAEEAPAGAPAPEPAKIDSGDTAWLLTSSALVLAMTAPGLALFYGGLVRRKNTLSTMMHSFVVLCLISVQWVLWGYSMAFGPDVGSIVGNLSYFGLAGVGQDALGTVPHLAFMVFQLVFAVITLALISGAVAERVKFSAFIVFGLL